MEITRAQVEDFFRARMDVNKYIENTVDWIRKIVCGARRERIVIGLSGGIDSAVSCALAAMAVGPENMFAYNLPSGQSSLSSIHDAISLAEKLGVNLDQIPIKNIVDAMIDVSNRSCTCCPDHFPALRRGNFAARARMCILMDQCEEKNGLLIGTENMTEHIVGYYTLYGDAGTIFEPICDLLKSEVRIVAEALGVTKEIIEKAPSAELWDGQTDEGEIGIQYHMQDLYILGNIIGEEYDIMQAFQDYASYDYTKLRDVIKRNAYKATIPICKKRSF